MGRKTGTNYLLGVPVAGHNGSDRIITQNDETALLARGRQTWRTGYRHGAPEPNAARGRQAWRRARAVPGGGAKERSREESQYNSQTHLRTPHGRSNKPARASAPPAALRPASRRPHRPSAPERPETLHLKTPFCIE